jgi:protein-tyrosine-phosphatase
VSSQAGPASNLAHRSVLFVCLGNSCRSQMAEAFARAYGGDVIVAESAGLSPAAIIQPATLQTMRERNISMDGQYPKGLELMAKRSFDVVVNMSGHRAPMPGGRLLEWDVPDPIGRDNDVYREVANRIEAMVMQLLLQLRGGVVSARPAAGKR